ncbi:MAG: AAA family ATPase [Alphaproteobacteria bacterium]|nr:AAA family ATPase [Alphaproteobacteria bacterium]
MKLKQFQIQNFRSISDSGPIHVGQLTSLLGRNESGKSNLLRALHSLNPSDGFKALNKVKDFPRHRRLEECSDSTPVVSTVWELDDADRTELADLWTRGATATAVRIGRAYGGVRTIGFEGVSAQEFDLGTIKSKARKIAPAVKAAAAKLDDTIRTPLEAAAEKFEADIAPSSDALAWASKAKAALAALRQALASADTELTDVQDAHVVDLEDLAEAIAGDMKGEESARQWVIDHMPVFMYLEEYPELNGHQNIAEFLQRKAESKLTPADKNFEKMCKVAGLRPDELQTLLNQKEHETRNQLANRASAVITSEIRRLWKDRSLTVRFDTDAEHINTFVSDPNSTFNVEVNLNERSRGFQWFFSFYMTFAADTKGGAAEDAILLLDEPGLYLHAKSQRDLLNHFEADFKNQILYTTHSPFMVPTHRLDTVRTVSITEEVGTTVSNDPSGDARTLFPLQAALGYDLAQSLFIGPNNLVVEGVTDYWALSSISEYLNSNGGGGLRGDITITPAGGAQKIPYMVALLSSEQLNVLALLDHEKDAKTTRDELVKSKLISDKNVIFIADAFGSSPPKEADIEDLIDAKVYETLVHESYANELKGVSLKVNDKIPRIAKRYEDAFKAAGLEFHKTRPMRLLLTKMGATPKQVATKDVVQRFEALCRIVNERLPKG